VDFQLSAHEYFSKKETFFPKLINNISKEEYFIFTRFLRLKPFKVVECDKNVGSAIISHHLYNKLCIDYLNTSNFEIISTDPLEEIKQKITTDLDNLLNNNDISSKLNNFLNVKNSKLGTFRALMKVHKQKFSTRPIINCKSHPTENISWLLDTIFKPIIKLTESYIQDSQNLLQNSKNMFFPSNCSLFSCDFESLYSNIDLDDALFVICDFMKNKINSKHLNIKALYNFLKLIFENNYFIFNKKYYRQLNGIAMGTKAGPSIANIYVYILEKSFLNIHRPLFYVRFIDDIFIITLSNFDISILPTFFKNLNLIISEKSKICNFLDLTISLSETSNKNGEHKLNFTVYKKPTDTFQQLLCSSNHQKSIIKMNPFGSYLRIRRICTYSHNYIDLARTLTDQLVTRGYERKVLEKTSNRVLRLDRDKLIKYKQKKMINLNKSILLKMKFDLNYIEIQNDLKLVFKECFKNHPLLSTYNLKILNKTQSNIGNLTINNVKPESLTTNIHLPKKCLLKNCKICCKFISSNFIKLNNFLLPLDLDVNCNTMNAVYAINCSLCPKVFYIGETERKVSVRIREHLRDIINFKPYCQYNSVVAYHFNLKEHILNRDFKFYIVQNELKIKKIRQDFENSLVHLFLKLDFKVINDPLKIKSRYNFHVQI